MTMNEEGRVTIPKEIRESIGIKPGDKIAFSVEGNRVEIKRVEKSKLSEILKSQKPWKEDSVSFQRRMVTLISLDTRILKEK